MQTEIDRICRQLRQAFSGEAWHGPSVLEILDGVNAGVACAKPIPGAHSIWEIVLHLTATQALLLRRMKGNAAGLTPEEDWPPTLKPSDEAWQLAVETLKNRERQLTDAVARFPSDRLDEPLISGGSSAYDNFHGHLQHNLYHAAQIGLLKRASSTSS